MSILLVIGSFLWIVIGTILMMAVAYDEDFNDHLRTIRLILCAAWPLTLVALMLMMVVVEVMWQFAALPSMRRIDKEQKP